MSGHREEPSRFRQTNQAVETHTGLPSNVINNKHVTSKYSLAIRL